MATTGTPRARGGPGLGALVMGLVVAGVVAVGLFAALTVDPGSAGDELDSPVALGPVRSTGVSELTLDPEALERLGLVTAPVRAAGEGRRIVPYSAVLYDPEGVPWTYVATSPLTFVRQRLRIVAIDGVVAVMNRGPAVGTKVVSIGGAELYGAEIDFGSG